jgi:hypothetical protein
MVEVCGSDVFYWNYCSILEINLYIIEGALEHVPDSDLRYLKAYYVNNTECSYCYERFVTTNDRFN